MNDNLITWTPQNIITVFLMSMIGWGLLSLMIVGIRSRQRGSSSSYHANSPSDSAVAL